MNPALLVIARRLLADRWAAARWWALGTVVGIAAVVALWPSVRGDADIERVVEDLPAGIRAMIGSQPGIPLSAAPGYLQARLYSTILPIVLLTYGIGLGSAAIGGAEEDGTLELVVTAPVSRARVALERLLASVLLLVGLAVIGLLATIALAGPVGLLDDVGPLRIAMATAAVACLSLLHALIAFAVGAATGRRGTAVAVASSVAVGGYLLQAIAASAETARPSRIVSPWWWLLDRNLLVEPPTPLAIGLPLLLSAALAGVGLLAFCWRDLRLP